MTGKDLILYILNHDLEDKPVFQNGKFLGFLTASEAATKFDVGLATIYVWFEFGILEGIKIGDEIYIVENAQRPKGIMGDLDNDVLNTFVQKHSE